MKKDVLIYFDLITSLKTTQEVSALISDIDTLMLTFFKSKKEPMKKALDLINVDTAKKMMQAFSESKLNIDDRDMVAGFFETLRKLVKKLKVIKLVLAFDPTRKMIENIHSFVENNIGIGYILDIEISPDVLGGAIVIHNGQYYDFTLKKQIENAFANKNAEILKFMT